MNAPSPAAITVAITVFERTDYISQAIESCLDQTAPVEVLVVEDCANSSRVRDLVTTRFGKRIRYIRNPVRRGIFGNWNACCDYADTEWISILHDDDFLAPTFVQAMVELGGMAGPQGAYFSRVGVLNDEHAVSIPETYDFPERWRYLDLVAFARQNMVLFPGQLLNVAAVRSLGGFNEHSQFAGDWDMWFKLAFHFGAAQTRTVAATHRDHKGFEKGTNKIVRMGRNRALDFVQCRRNLNLLRSRYPDEVFSRKSLLNGSPIPIRQLYQTVGTMSPRMARYQWGLLLRSTPPNVRYALFRWIAAIVGPEVFRRALSTANKLFRPRAIAP